MNSVQPACLFCGNEAELFCDAVIGIAPTGAVRDGRGEITALLTGVCAEQFTCDAPVCSEHARQIGHVCRDSIDHCSHHAGHSERAMGLKNLVMFPAEADAKRRNTHATIRRSAMFALRETASAEAKP